MDGAEHAAREAELAAVTIGPLEFLDGPVSLHEYDSRWPDDFAREEQRIRRALGDGVLGLEHVGSTSVPGLVAKPRIDILLVVADPADEASYAPALQAAGYTLRIREPDWHEHRLFNGPETDVNLHVFAPDSPEIERLLHLRDRLRSHAGDRERYAAAKRELAARRWRHMQDYADAKTGVIETILRRAVKMPDMRYRQLGDSELQISEISLGSWLTYSGGVGREQTKACTRAAFEAGINFFDTANVYGRGAAEEAWGAILAGHDRDSYVLATKVYFPMSDADRGLSAQQIHKQIDASLTRLRTDFVDLYQCHRYDTQTPLEETVRALSDVIRAGKARYWGFSEWTAEQIEAAVTIAREQGLEKPVSSQPQYSLLWRRIEDNGVLRVCEENGISQIVWSPLAQGVLSGKYEPGAPPPEGTRAASEEMGGFISGFFRDDVLEAVQRLAPIAEQAGLSPAQLALAWILRQPNVASAIIGASRPEQVSENAAAAEVVLGDDTLRAIDEALGGAARLGAE